jgi:hypothetical protein
MPALPLGKRGLPKVLLGNRICARGWGSSFLFGDNLESRNTPALKIESFSMKVTHWLRLATVLFSSIFTGCKDATLEKPKAPNKTAAKGDPEDEVKANLAKLDPDDRKLAEAQKFCAVDNENRLGSMGAPVKVMVKEQPVFLCCKSCQKSALADPEKTIAKVEELKKKSAEPPAK